MVGDPLQVGENVHIQHAHCRRAFHLAQPLHVMVAQLHHQIVDLLLLREDGAGQLLVRVPVQEVVDAYKNYNQIYALASDELREQIDKLLQSEGS